MRRVWAYGLLTAVVAAALGAAIYSSLRGPGPEPAPVAEPTPSGPGQPETPAPPPPTAGADNSCVACHRGLAETAFVGHTFADWQNSLHAQQGVTCQDCHGGDPTPANKDRAHRGVKPSRAPDSLVHFQRIPATCGRCHDRELDYFQQSVHHTQLRETGRGPNCVTCHGAMAITILNPEELAATCAACHNARLGILPDEPLKFRFLLALMDRAQSELALVATLLDLRRMQGQAISSAEAFLEQARQAMQTVRQEWHTFRLAQVEVHLERVFALVQQTMATLGVEGGLDVPQ